jgi:hypothetical protein
MGDPSLPLTRPLRAISCHRGPEDVLGRPLVLSLGPPFQHRKQYGWGIDFYIRVDRVGCYHTYPHIGGPYEGLQEAENAIERYLDDKRHKTLYGFPISFVFFFLLSNFFLLAQFASAHCYFPCDKTI